MIIFEIKERTIASDTYKALSQLFPTPEGSIRVKDR